MREGAKPFYVVFAIAAALVVPAMQSHCAPSFTRSFCKSVRITRRRSVTFTTIITYEVTKIWKALGTRALEAFFGIRK